MSRPASASIASQSGFAAAGRVGSIELLGGVACCGGVSGRQCPSAIYEKMKRERGRQRKEKMAERAQSTG